MARGGYRPGAGRPNKSGKVQPQEAQKSDIPDGEPGPMEDLAPLDYMLKIMNDPAIDKARRDKMAIAAAPFMHSRKGEGAGKKEEKSDRAKTAGAGRFAASPPPLRVVK
jgi:hypothetical protein